MPWGTPAGKWIIGGASFGETTATALGIPYVLGAAQGISRARYYPGVKPVRVKLLAEPSSLRLIGAQIVGGEGVKERADFLAMAIKFGFTFEDLATMENVLLAGHWCAERADRARRPERPRPAEERVTCARHAGFGTTPSTTCWLPRKSKSPGSMTLARRAPAGRLEIFWRRVFAPLYRALPWPLRHKILLSMPGSHRRQWAPPPRAHGPAV